MKTWHIYFSVDGLNLKMTSLITELKNCWEKCQNIRSVLRVYGVQVQEDIKRPLNTLNDELVLAQILNWIMWHMENEDDVELRIPESKERTVYVVELIKNHQRGMRIQNMRNVPKLFGKVLYHWNNGINCESLSLKEIKISIECADTLNSFNDDILQQKIDELINDAIQLELPDGCVCDCCIFASNMEYVNE